MPRCLRCGNCVFWRHSHSRRRREWRSGSMNRRGWLFRRDRGPGRNRCRVCGIGTRCTGWLPARARYRREWGGCGVGRCGACRKKGCAWCRSSCRHGRRGRTLLRSSSSAAGATGRSGHTRRSIVRPAVCRSLRRGVPARGLCCACCPMSRRGCTGGAVVGGLRRGHRRSGWC